MTHYCTDACVCPVHETPLFFSPRTGAHACQDETCVHAHEVDFGAQMPAHWPSSSRERILRELFADPDVVTWATDPKNPSGWKGVVMWVEEERW